MIISYATDKMIWIEIKGNEIWLNWLVFFRIIFSPRGHYSTKVIRKFPIKKTTCRSFTKYFPKKGESMAHPHPLERTKSILMYLLANSVTISKTNKVKERYISHHSIRVSYIIDTSLLGSDHTTHSPQWIRTA